VIFEPVHPILPRTTSFHKSKKKKKEENPQMKSKWHELMSPLRLPFPENKRAR
jgi:hypothetical protein